MSDSRKPLTFTAGKSDDLSDFKPREKSQDQDQVSKAKAIDRVSSFPSREAPDDDQINIKASSAVLGRFRAMAKAERYKHGEFLEILMNAYERKSG